MTQGNWQRELICVLLLVFTPTSRWLHCSLLLLLGTREPQGLVLTREGALREEREAVPSFPRY